MEVTAMDTNSLELRYRTYRLLRAVKEFVSLTEISRETKIPVSMLSRYANGTTLPSLATAKKLLDYLLSKEVTTSIVAKAIRVYNGFYNISGVIMDPRLLELVAEYVTRRFGGRFTRVLTPEAGGISLATSIAIRAGVPMVVARKQRPPAEGQVLEIISMSGPASYSVFYVPRRELPRDSRVLIVDDFSIHGTTLRALVELVNRAGARVAGAFVVVGVGDDWKVVSDAEALIEIKG